MIIDYFRSDIHVGKEVVASVQQWHVLVTSNSQKHPSSSFCDRLTCLKAAFPHPDKSDSCEQVHFLVQQDYCRSYRFDVGRKDPLPLELGKI